MANWNGHFILTVFGDFYPALNGDFCPPLTLQNETMSIRPKRFRYSVENAIIK